MLYKNLPQEELNKVMRIRTCLDYLAAFNFLLQGHWDNASAVMRARKEYKRLCPSFSLSREENMRKKTLNPIPERTKSSILWDVYKRQIFKNAKTAGVNYLVAEIEKYSVPVEESVEESLDYLLNAPFVKSSYAK